MLWSAYMVHVPDITGGLGCNNHPVGILLYLYFFETPSGRRDFLERMYCYVASCH